MNIPLGWAIALISTLAGFLWLGGSWHQLWVPQEYLIIMGAALGTLIASNKFRNLKNLGLAFKSLFVRASITRQTNIQLLNLMFELLQQVKKNGVRSIESDIENPSASAIFSKYPEVTKNPRLVEFITDYLRMMLDGSVTLGQIETIMHQEIEVLHEEMHQPSHSMMTLSDSLPAFGIVAAIVGVIRALTSIGTSTPGQIGEMIASALLGTLFGVFAAYALLGPIGRTLQQVAEIELRPYQAVKEILIAHYSDFSPMIAVEYGRKVLYSDQRPSMLELESGVRDASRAASK
jgi:chemotaxis protein MotA